MKRFTYHCKHVLLLKLTIACSALLVMNLVRAEEGAISFKRDVAPVFLENCIACHDAKKAEGGYRIDTFTELSKPGDSGLLPLAGAQDDVAELLRRLKTEDQFERMPAEAEAIDPSQIQVVADWIKQGAKFDGDNPDERLSFVIPPRDYPPAPTPYPARLQVTALAFSSNRNLIYSGGYHELLVWDIDGNLQHRIGNVGQQTFAIEFPPKISDDKTSGADGNWVVVASGSPGLGGEVRLIDLTNHQVTAVLARCDDLILDLAFRPDGKKLAIAAADKTIRIVDMESQEIEQTLLSHADFVTAIAWSADGTKLVSASRDKSAKVFNAETGQLLVSYQGHGDAVRGVCVLPDGKQVVSTGNDNKMHRWNISDAKKTVEIAIGGEGYHIEPADNCVLVPSSDKRLLKIDLANNKVTTEFKGHADWVLCSAVHPDLGKVASGSHDGEIRVWDLADGTMISRWLAQPTDAGDVKSDDAKTTP